MNTHAAATIRHYFAGTGIPAPQGRRLAASRFLPALLAAALLAVPASESAAQGSNGDDHGDTRATATVVTIPSNTSGRLESDGDEDYFRIEVGQSGSLQLETTGSTDTYGLLYDSGGGVVDASDDEGNGRNFRISQSSVSPGTYYLKVRGYHPSITGRYGLSVTGTARAGSSITRRPDLVVEAPRTYNAAPAAGASFVISATVLNRGDAAAQATTLRYYRSSNATINASDTSVGTDPVSALAAGRSSLESVSVTAPTQPGTYYYGACVEPVNGETAHRNNCSTGVEVVVTGSGGGGNGNGNGNGDDHGDTRSTATVVTIPSTTAGRLDSGDEDYFRIDVGQGGILRLETTGSIDTYGELFDGNGSSIETNDDNGSGRNFRIETGILDVGTYYLKVRGFAASSIGNYSLSVTGSAGGGISGNPDLVVQSASVNDAAPVAGASFTFSATVVNQGSADSRAATLRYYRSTNATINAADTAVGTDAVSTLGVGITSPESISLTAPSQPGTYYYGACVDAVSGETATGNNCSSGVRVVVPDSGTGGNGNGGNGGNNGDDHGNSRVTATVVAIPSTTPGQLDVDDEDYFRLDVGQGASLRLESTGDVDTYGEFHDVNGALISENDDGGASLNFRIDTGALDAGSYYLKVRGYSGSITGSYNLSVTGNAGGGSLTSPDLTVESAAVTDAAPAAGAAFTLRATVRNRGDARSAATTLRYYRSDDATISGADTSVGADAVSALSAGATSPESISLTAPDQPGTYYYGACVAAVTGETASGNNCSSGVEIVVPSRVNPTPDTPVVTIAFGSVFTYGTDASTVTEGNDTHFTVTVSPRPESNLTVNLMVSQNGNFAESFQLGSRSVTFDTAHYYNNHRPDDSTMWRVSTRDDGSPEADGSITVTLVDGDGYTVGSPSSATVAVTDNDAGRVPPALVPNLDPDSDLRPAQLEYFYFEDFGIHSGHSTELYGGESLRLVFMHAPAGNTNYDEIEFSWSVEGGGSIVSIPGRGRNDRLVAYRAPAYVAEEFTATVTNTVTVRGKGVITRYGTSDSQEFTLDLTVRPSSEAPASDRRGPTSERGDTYADGYVFWNGGQDVSFDHNPWINTTPGRTITYSFPEEPFSRNDRDLVPLRSGDPEFFRNFGWKHSTQGLREQFRQAFAHWEQYLNLRFREVDDDPNADWLIGQDPERGDGSLASTYTGGGNTSSVAIATTGHFFNASRRYEPEGALHEIGHALGLGHPHDQGAGANLDDSLMEYEEHGREQFIDGEYIWLKFPADIIAAQHIWGKAPGAPRTVPDVPRTVTLAFDSNRNELVADWSNVLINGGSPVTGWVLEWLRGSDPAATDTPLGGGVIERTDRITNPATRRATFASPGEGDWSVQLRASNALGDGLRKRGPGTGATAVGTGTTTTPITPTQNACVPAQLLTDVQGYAGEHRPNSPDHVERWSRVLAAFGESNSYSSNPMTASEAQTQADRGLDRWVPVAAALQCLETPSNNPLRAPVLAPSGASGEVGISQSGQGQEIDPAPERWTPVDVVRVPAGSPPGLGLGDGACVSPQLRSEVSGRAREIWRGQAHVESWLRVMQTFSGTAGDAAIVTPAEAQFYAAAGLNDWLPVAAALSCLETEALHQARPR